MDEEGKVMGLPREIIAALRRIELSDASAEQKIAAYNAIRSAAIAEQAAADRAAIEARAFALGGPHIISPPIKEPLRRRFLR